MGARSEEETKASWDQEDGDISLKKGDSLAFEFESEKGEKPSNLTGEYGNIALLLLLYTLQGVPMGISSVLPLVLKERGASYSELGSFSLNSTPFSLKLLWAPIVDAAYFPQFGRRKTWLVPSQLLIGFVMVALSSSLDDLLYQERPQVMTLTIAFFFLYFLCATQDIAVDGWALTMLRKENVSYAATCNLVGQTFGYTVGFTGYMTMQHFKLLTLSSFMCGWGLLFIVFTVCLAIGKKEENVHSNEEVGDVAAAYRQMLAMTRLPSIRALVLVLMTWKAGFATMDAVAPLKLQEYGVPKEHLAYLSSLISPLYILLPAVVARWTSSSEPLGLALQAYPVRIALVPVTALLVACTPSKMDPVPYGFYIVVMLLSIVGAVAAQSMYVSHMSFFARISDPAMGGTYMTLLNTMCNLGGTWPPTLTLFLVDATSCLAENCAVKRDGFYVMSAVGFVISITWYALGAGLTRKLQTLRMSEWKVR